MVITLSIDGQREGGRQLLSERFEENLPIMLAIFFYSHVLKPEMTYNQAWLSVYQLVLKME